MAYSRGFKAVIVDIILTLSFGFDASTKLSSWGEVMRFRRAGGETQLYILNQQFEEARGYSSLRAPN